jgi:hypothetical protein
MILNIFHIISVSTRINVNILSIYFRIILIFFRHHHNIIVKTTIIKTLAAAVTISSAAVASATADSKVAFTDPVPTKIVAPRIPLEKIGTEVEMRFEIGIDGIPSKIKSNASPFDAKAVGLAQKAKVAIKKWRFIPAKDADGNAISTTVAIPIKATNDISEDFSSNEMLVALRN